MYHIFNHSSIVTHLDWLHFVLFFPDITKHLRLGDLYREELIAVEIQEFYTSICSASYGRWDLCDGIMDKSGRWACVGGYMC